MKRSNIFIWYIFINLFLINFVSAQPPFQVNTIISNGMEIAGVDFSAIKTDTQRTAVANVYNASDGKPLNSGVWCQFQVFRVAEKGALVHTNQSPININNTFYFGIPNTVYNVSGEYTRVIQCNNSVIGGFYKSTFLANPTGIESNESRSVAVSRGIYILFAISLILFIAFLFIKQKPPVKWTLFLLSIMFFLPAMNILFVEMQDQVVNPNIENFFSFFTAASFYMFWFAFGLLAVMWFLTLLQTLIMRNKIAKGLKYG